MDIIYILKVLKRKLWMVLLFPVIAIAVAYFLTKDAEEQFKSTAQLATGFTINDGLSLSDEKFNPRDADMKFNNVIEIMNSPLVGGLLSYKLILHDLTSPTPFRTIDNTERNNILRKLGSNGKQKAVKLFKQKLDSMEVLSSFDETEATLMALLRQYGYNFETLKENLTVKRLNYTDYITLEYKSENPKLSAFVVNQLCQQFFAYNNSLRKERSGESLEYLTTLVAQKKQDYEDKASLLQSYKSSNQVLNYEAESESKIAQLSNLETQKAEQESLLRTAQIQLQGLNKKIKELESYASGNENNARLLSVRRKINALNARYISTGASNETLYDSLVVLRTELAELMQNSDYLGTTTPKASKGDLLAEKDLLQMNIRAYESNIASIRSRMGGLRGTASDFVSKEATISKLTKEMEIASTEYLNAQERLNNAKNATLTGGNSIKQVLYGQPATSPEPSKKLIIIGLSGMASLAMCIFIIVFIEFIDMSIKTAPRLERITDMKLAGSINLVKGKNIDLERIFNENELDEEDLKMYKHLLRKLRHEVESHKSETIMVTSTKEGEGKSFMILSLAYSLSLINKRVLIIDTNFKNNTLTEMLLSKPHFNKLIEMGKEPKLLLLNAAHHTNGNGNGKGNYQADEEYVKSIISPTTHEKIDIIGSQKGTDSPSEVFSGRDFRALIHEMKKIYDYILLEGASLNKYSDARELSQYVDKVIPVFSANSVINQIDKESIRYLKTLDRKLMGAVLNKVDVKNLEL